MLTEQQATFLRQELETAKNPLFIYDDDADGLASFLLLYKIHREGKSLVLNSAPTLSIRFAPKVQEIDPDKIFVLDVPEITQEFIDTVKKPIFWLDHHQPVHRTGVHYFNPRLTNPDSYIPTTRMAYQVSQQESDLWIAVVGCLADWYLPDFVFSFKEKYPVLLSLPTPEIQTGKLPHIVYKEPIGILVKLFFFLLKGPTSEVRNSVKILTRIKSPDEILQQQTAQGKFLFNRFQKMNQKYKELLLQAKKQVRHSKIFIFIYNDNKWSFTANLANELMALYPNKIVIVGRKRSEEVKCSVRASFAILPLLERALVGINGYGGGHAQACGLVVKEDDWERFLDNFKRELMKE